MTWSPLQLRAQQRAQALGVPVGLRALRAPVLVLQVAQPGAQLGGQRRHLRRGRDTAAAGLRRAAGRARRTPSRAS